MIRHIALFRCVEGTTDASVTAACDALEALVAEVPDLISLETHVDLDLIEGTYDFGLIAEFADEAGFHAYQSHPAHDAVVAEFVAPIIEHVARTQQRRP